MMTRPWPQEDAGKEAVSRKITLALVKVPSIPSEVRKKYRLMQVLLFFCVLFLGRNFWALIGFQGRGVKYSL